MIRVNGIAQSYRDIPLEELNPQLIALALDPITKAWIGTPNLVALW